MKTEDASWAECSISIRKQQNIDDETGEMGGDQIDDGRGHRGHRRRIEDRSTHHIFTKNGIRQEQQDQC
eukprot:4061300-Heterocapsa_arctica.AAC.1